MFPFAFGMNALYHSSEWWLLQHINKSEDFWVKNATIKTWKLLTSLPTIAQPICGKNGKRYGTNALDCYFLKRSFNKSKWILNARRENKTASLTSSDNSMFASKINNETSIAKHSNTNINKRRWKYHNQFELKQVEFDMDSSDFLYSFEYF